MVLIFSLLLATVNKKLNKIIYKLDVEEQDAYILGVAEPMREFTRKIIAIVHRNDDVEERWVVAPNNMIFTKEEIEKQIYLQEQFF